MAPNLTLPNTLYLVESPLDLSMSPNSDWKKKSNYQEMRITSLRLPTSQSLKTHEGFSSLPKGERIELGFDCRKQLNGKFRNIFDSQADIRRHEIARKWLKENLLQTNKAVIYTLITAYSLFCRENGEQPVSESAFLDIIKTEFSGHCKDDRAVSLPKINTLVKPNSSSFLLNQKRKLATCVEDELKYSETSGEIQRNLKTALEQGASIKQSAMSKYLKLNIDDVSDNETDSVKLFRSINKENSEGCSKALKFAVPQKHEERYVTFEKHNRYSSFKGTQATKNECDSDSSDSGCEETRMMKNRIKLKANDESTLPRRKKVSFESNSLPLLNQKLQKQTSLEFGSDSCDSGLDSFDSDADKHADSDYESHQLRDSTDDERNKFGSSEYNKRDQSGSSKEDKRILSDSTKNDKRIQSNSTKTDERIQSDSSEVASQDEEMGPLTIDETRSAGSPIQLDNEGIPPSLQIKEELFTNEDSVGEVNQNVASCEDINHKAFIDCHKKVISKVISLLNLKGYSDSKCILDARKLSDVFVKMLDNYLLGLFLQVFGHSMSCKARQCSKLCFMFKRIMKHITSASSHKCAVKHLYGHILRLHIDTCKDINCGISNCKLLRGKRLDKRSDPLESLD